MTLVLYGIANCDTVRKARRWLDDRGVSYRFHDLRAEGLDEDRVKKWIADAGWEAVINRRSTSWKTLPAATRDSMDAASAVDAACATPTLIKRPVLQGSDLLEIGFRAERYGELLTPGD